MCMYMCKIHNSDVYICIKYIILMCLYMYKIYNSNVFI